MRPSPDKDAPVELNALEEARRSLRRIVENEPRRKQAIAELYEDIERRRAHADALLGLHRSRERRPTI